MRKLLLIPFFGLGGCCHCPRFIGLNNYPDGPTAPNTPLEIKP